MGYTEKTHTWDDNWNDVMRTEIFQDEKQMAQMRVPEGTPINMFKQKYFIDDASPDALLTNEEVRINYYDTQGWDTGNKNVKKKYKNFDIYVKESLLYNATEDRLKSRAVQIAERIKYLLQKNEHICGLKFYYEDEYNLWTKTVGYARYHIIFSYKITV